MLIEWVSSFQYHANEIERLVLKLADTFDAASDAETIAHQERIVGLTDLLVDWARSLPSDDDQLWSYMGLTSIFHNMLSSQGNLMSSLFYLDNRRRNTSTAPVRDHVQANLHLMDSVRKWAAAHRDDPQDCPPAIIINELCLRVYSRELMQLPSDFQIQDWPRVAYHPDIHELLQGMAIWMWNPESTVPLRLAVHQSRHFCEIVLTGAGFYITPDSWFSIMDPGFNHIETLRSIGGQIEPLVWHDEPGDGVIVRLPWAK